MVKHRGGSSQSCRTFLHNHREGIVSVDLLTTPTIAFERLYAFVILRQLRREIVGIAVTRHPTAEWLARQITEAFPWDTAPAILIRDNDKVFGTMFGVASERWASAIIRSLPDHPGRMAMLNGSSRHGCVLPELIDVRIDRSLVGV